MFLLTSLLACLILSLFMPCLGQKVLARRIVFIDLALAQIAATGYAIGLATDSSGPMWAGGVTLVCVFILAGLPHASKLPKEAVMAAAYAVAAATGMILLSSLPHAEGHMSDLMFGILLGADWSDLIVLAVAGVAAVSILHFAGNDTYLQRLLFYLALAVAVVPAIHALGIILVFGMLLLPALMVWRGDTNGPLWQAVVVALLGSVAGVLCAEFFDLPPSSSVVLAIFLCGLPVLMWRYYRHDGLIR
ncbi:MAG: metal ABC transporter permease [Mariprofundaceae bacterium]|nr:metal ABC transporter permease [Mariprofundaceae bacterium]